MRTHRTAHSYLTRSSDYINSAKSLVIQCDGGGLKLRSEDPVDLLVSHAFELSLKALLLHSGATGAASLKFGHDISKLYEFLSKNTDFLGPLSDHISEMWYDQLVSDRRPYVGHLGEFGDAVDISEVPSETTIKSWTFDLTEDVKWYSRNMNTGGNLFRYHQDRLYSGHKFNFFGNAYHVPRQSLIWATEHLNDQMARNMRTTS